MKKLLSLLKIMAESEQINVLWIDLSQYLKFEYIQKKPATISEVMAESEFMNVHALSLISHDNWNLN